MDFLIASRRQRPGDDPIFSLAAEADRRAKAGEPIINATIGTLLEDDGRLAVMPSVVEAVNGLDPATVAGYAPIPGRADFRQAVLDDLLGDYGLVPRATCVATPGGTGALRLAIDNFLEHGQTVLTSSYYWGPYRTLADESGHAFATFRMFDAAGRFDVADLERMLEASLASQGRALVILNTPCHNPTGYSLDQAEWDALVQVIDKHAPSGPITLLLDIAYGYYAPGGLSSLMKNVERLIGKCMVLLAWSASKSFAEYGLRIGSLVAIVPDDEERRRITNAFSYSCRGIWSNCNAGGMAAITRVLSDPERRARVLTERARLIEMLARRVRRWNELASAAGIRYPRYDGGFFTTVFNDDPAGLCAKLREKGIYLVPLQGAARVAVCAVNEKQLEPIVAALAEALAR